MCMDRRHRLIDTQKQATNIHTSVSVPSPDHQFNFMMKSLLTSGKVREGAMKHFTPRYNPWEQRVCADPDGKFYVVVMVVVAVV